jgi:hypothetical protein
MTKTDIEALAAIVRKTKEHKQAYPKGNAFLVLEDLLAAFCFPDDYDRRERFLDDCAIEGEI